MPAGLETYNDDGSVRTSVTDHFGRMLGSPTIDSDQLEAIEDGERVAGTEREWRNYRTQVRGWKLGAEGYPDSNLRPARPN